MNNSKQGRAATGSADAARTRPHPSRVTRRMLRCVGILLIVAASAGCTVAKPSADSEAKRPWTGEVTYVTDGDTLWVRPERGSPPRKLRLDGIDAPEICQAYGEESKAALVRRVLHRQVTVSTRATDDYNRALVTLRLDGEDVGGWMVTQGHAWSYQYRQDDGPYAAEEQIARRRAKGLFADAGAERPRAFRLRHGSCHVPRD
jgi:endonuclease YncB( thermonuclease family)